MTLRRAWPWLLSLTALGFVPAHAAPGTSYPLALRALAATTADSTHVHTPAVPIAPRPWKSLLRPDRAQHASLSLTLALASGLAARDAGAGLGFALALGVAKELYDIGGTGFDVLDLLADTIGASAGAGAAAAIID